MTYSPPPQYPQVPPGHQQKGVGGFGVAAVVMGGLAAIVAWVPLCGVVAFPIAGIGLVLAVVGIIVAVSGGRTRMAMSVVGGVVCLLAIGIQVASLAYTVYRSGKAIAASAAAAATQPTTSPAEPGAPEFLLLSKGDTVMLRSPTGYITLARTKEEYDRYDKLGGADDAAGKRQMVDDGRIFRVQSGTRARVVEADLFLPVVEILKGPHAGKLGVVAHDRVGSPPAIPPPTSLDF